MANKEIDISGVSIDKIELDDIYRFLSQEKNSKDDLVASPEIVRFLDLMEKCRSMYLRINEYGNRQSIINYLMVKEKLSEYKAKELFESALEFFYADSEVSKKAWRNILAEKMEKVINFAMQTMENANDASRVVKMIADQAKVLGLDQPDPPNLPPMERPFKIYSSNPEDFENMPKVNQKKLAIFIDALEIAEPEKIRLKKDAGILPQEIPFIEEKDA